MGNCLCLENQHTPSQLSYQLEGYQRKVVDEDSFEPGPRDIRLDLTNPESKNQLKRPYGRQQAYEETQEFSCMDSGQALKETYKKIIKSKIRIPNLFLSENENFHELVFKHFTKTISYFAENKQKFTFIAKHKLGEQGYSSQVFGKLLRFQFEVEKGDEPFSTDNCHQQKQLLWEKELPEIIWFLKCIIGGIIELQKAKMFHPDLAWRNIIRRTLKSGTLYKFIDFDFFFAIKQEPNNRSVFQSTKKIVNYLLELQNLQFLADYMFVNCQKVNKKIYNALTEIWLSKESKEDKVSNVFKVLEQYSLCYHKKQFLDILTYVLDKTKCKYEWTQIMKNIEEISVDNLEQNLKGYKKFMDKLETMIRNLSDTHC